jgi:hypothetical protein
MQSFKTFIAPTKIRVEVSDEVLQLNEATRATVGQYTARRDQPHFQGDEYHAHSELPGGYEVSWGISGARRHTNKFLAQIPVDAKAAVAKVLGVKPDMLEGYRILDDTINEEVLLIEVRPS